MDDKEMKKQACIFMTVALLYCIFILGTYQIQATGEKNRFPCYISNPTVFLAMVE